MKVIKYYTYNINRVQKEDQLIQIIPRLAKRRILIVTIDVKCQIITKP